jgi:hypothetical protein
VLAYWAGTICVTEGDRISPFFLSYPTGDHSNEVESQWIWPEQEKPGYKSFYDMEVTCIKDILWE